MCRACAGFQRRSGDGGTYGGARGGLRVFSGVVAALEKAGETVCTRDGGDDLERLVQRRLDLDGPQFSLPFPLLLPIPTHYPPLSLTKPLPRPTRTETEGVGVLNAAKGEGLSGGDEDGGVG